MTRLDQVKPFALHMPMVAAAGPGPVARQQIEVFLNRGRRRLKDRLLDFLAWLSGAEGRACEDWVAQRRFTIVRLHFQSLVTQFDIFADALTQRSEHEFGVWLAGLDALADDALAIPGAPYKAPPLLCYLDRGFGAAIRRARTRLPGGDSNPVAIIRVPRERMIGTSVASSLVHEVGHQGDALLGLVDSLRPALKTMHAETGRRRSVWQWWDRWISEIVADFWSVALLGIGATYGMIGVVSLPPAFVFRVSPDDPHPPPWVRVRLSAAFGSTLYPDAQWGDLMRLWSRLYPISNLVPDKQEIFGEIDQSMPEFVSILINHRPGSLNGASLAEAFPLEEHAPARLRRLLSGMNGTMKNLANLNPTLALAALGQARADGNLGPPDEKRILDRLLTIWAARRAVAPACGCSC